MRARALTGQSAVPHAEARDRRARSTSCGPCSATSSPT